MIEKLRDRRSRIQFSIWCAVALGIALLCNYQASQVWDPACTAEATGRQAGAQELVGMPPSFWCGSAFKFIYKQLIPDVTVQFIAATLTAMFFIGLLALLRDYEDEARDIDILFQPHQTQSHDEALAETKFWYHDGHLASWVRRKVLPAFDARCHNHMLCCEIKVAIMDPTDDLVCQVYVDHIRPLSEKERRFNDVAEVRAELCASIYALTTGLRTGHLDVEIYLKKQIDFIRDDISETRAFWTTVGNTVPAILLVNRKNRFLYYNLALKNFASSIKLHRKLDTQKGHRLLQTMLEKSEKEKVKALLADCFPGNDTLTDDKNIERTLVHLHRR